MSISNLSVVNDYCGHHHRVGREKFKNKKQAIILAYGFLLKYDLSGFYMLNTGEN